MASVVYWRKALRDLWENKARALLVVFALFIGVVSVGTVAVAYSILPREMDKNYLKTDPASATLAVDYADDELVEKIIALPQIAEAEARCEIIGRFQTEPGEWGEFWLYVVPDFLDIRLDKFTPEKGAWPPATGEILLERTALGVARKAIGEDIVIKVPTLPTRTLRVSGTVHTPGLPPAWVESRVYGYVNLETLALFGGSPRFDSLKILVAENRFDKAAITNTANDLKAWLAANGHAVSGIGIPEPGKHPHADLMAAFIAMLGAMGLFAMFMSGVLVTNMISAILGRQIRQVGIMKAIGGSARQITGIYASMVLMLGLMAIAAGLPLSLVLGRSLARYEAVQMLNFTIFDAKVDLWAYFLIIAVGILIPVISGAFPIVKGTRITVLAALCDHGTGKGKIGAGRLDLWLSGIKSNARSFLLSLRNAFRRRGRLVLTLLTLTVAGASFITAMNVAASIDKAVEKKFEATPYDIDIAFSAVYPQAEIEKTVKLTEGVEAVETWASAWATTLPDDGGPGSQIRVIAPRIDTPLSPKPPIGAGRWLLPDDENAIVLNTALMKMYRIEAAIGDEVSLDIGGRKTTWRLVGTTKEFMSQVGYASNGYFTRTVEHRTNTVVKLKDRAASAEVKKALEIRLASAEFDVYTMWETAGTRKVMEDHMVLITGILLFMAAIFVIIGALGLASTMSLNVLDRTRELGIMRAIGASTQDILRIIVTEGAVIGALSWCLAVLLSVPYSIAMGQVFAVLLKNPMSLTTSMPGWGIWIVIVIAIGAISSALPAWSGTRRPVNEALAYE